MSLSRIASFRQLLCHPIIAKMRALVCVTSGGHNWLSILVLTLYSHYPLNRRFPHNVLSICSIGTKFSVFRIMPTDLYTDQWSCLVRAILQHKQNVPWGKRHQKRNTSDRNYSTWQIHSTTDINVSGQKVVSFFCLINFCRTRSIYRSSQVLFTSSVCWDYPRLLYA